MAVPSFAHRDGSKFHKYAAELSRKSRHELDDTFEIEGVPRKALSNQ